MKLFYKNYFAKSSILDAENRIKSKLKTSETEGIYLSIQVGITQPKFVSVLLSLPALILEAPQRSVKIKI